MVGLRTLRPAQNMRWLWACQGSGLACHSEGSGRPMLKVALRNWHSEEIGRARLLPSRSATIGGSLSSKSLTIEILCNVLPNRLGFISL